MIYEISLLSFLLTVTVLWINNLTFAVDCENDARIESLQLEQDKALKWAFGSKNHSFTFNFSCIPKKKKHCRISLCIDGISKNIDCESSKTPTDLLFADMSSVINCEENHKLQNKTAISVKVTLDTLSNIGQFPVEIKFTHKETCSHILTSFNISYCSADISPLLEVTTSTRENAAYGNIGTFKCKDDRAQAFYKDKPAKNTTCNEDAEWVNVFDIECWSEPDVRLTSSRNGDTRIVHFTAGEQANFSCNVAPSEDPSFKVFFILGSCVHPKNFTVNYTHHDMVAYCNYSNNFIDYYGDVGQSNNVTFEVFFPPEKRFASLSSKSCCNTSLPFCDATIDFQFKSNPILYKNNFSLSFGGKNYLSNITGDCKDPPDCDYRVVVPLMEREVKKMVMHTVYADTKYGKWNKPYNFDIISDTCDKGKAETTTTAAETLGSTIIIVASVGGGLLLIIVLFIILYCVWRKRNKKKLGAEPQYENAPVGILQEKSAYVNDTSFTRAEPNYANAPVGILQEESAYVNDTSFTRAEPKYENAPVGILQEESNISVAGAEPEYENDSLAILQEKHAYAVVI